MIHDTEFLIVAADSTCVNIECINIDNRKIPASKYGKIDEDSTSVNFTEEEKKCVGTISQTWANILNVEVADEMDFFACGDGSMNVLMLVEEVKDLLRITIQNTDVFMPPIFVQSAMVPALAGKGASGSGREAKCDPVDGQTNMDLRLSIVHGRGVC